MSVPSCLLGSLAAILLVTPAAATDKGPYKVRAGGSATVLTYASYNPVTCYFAALPRIKVVRPPEHGTIETGVRSETMDTGPCQGKTFKWTVVIYHAKSGFRGRDTLTVDAETDIYVDGTATRSNRMDITVDVR